MSNPLAVSSTNLCWACDSASTTPLCPACQDKRCCLHGILGVCPRCCRFVEILLAARSAKGIKPVSTLNKAGIPVFTPAEIRTYWISLQEQTQVMNAELRLRQIEAGNIKPMRKPLHTLEEMQQFSRDFVRAACKVYKGDAALMVQIGELPDCFNYEQEN